MLDPELAKRLQARRSKVEAEGNVWTKTAEASSADARGEWLIVEGEAEDWSLLPAEAGKQEAGAASASASQTEPRPRPAQAKAWAAGRVESWLPRPSASFVPPGRAAGSWRKEGIPGTTPEKTINGAAASKEEDSVNRKPSSDRERIEKERATKAVDCAKRWPQLLHEEVGAADSTADATPEEGAEKEADGEAGGKEAFVVSHKDMKVIQADIQRTRAADPAFQVPEMHSRLESLLTGFCVKERVGYTQGLHEIAAVFAFVKTTAPEGVMDDAAALACFASFIHRFIPYFHDKEEFVALHISLLFFRQLLFYHHPDLHNQLEEASVSPFLYATPWFITLFAARTPLSVLLCFWDKYIIRNEACFLPFLAVAMLVSRKAAILAAGLDQAHSEVARAGVKTVQQFEDIWAAAEELRAQTPQSFLLRLSRVLDAVKEKRGLPAPSEKPWSGRVLAQVERERYFMLLPQEIVAYCVIELRAAAVAAGEGGGQEGGADGGAGGGADGKAQAPTGKVIKPRLRLLLLDVRPPEEHGVEHLPQALHFHPPCLRRLVSASHSRGQPRLERLAAALSSAVSYSISGLMSSSPAGAPGESPQAAPGTTEQPGSGAATPASGVGSPVKEVAIQQQGACGLDGALVAEVLEALKAEAAERWGEDWISESARAHLVLMGGAADAADAAGESNGGGGAVAPLYEALTEHLSLARVSVVLGGAPAVQREALKRGLELGSSANAQSARRGESLLESAWSRLQAASEKLPAADAMQERMGGLLGRGAEAARTLAGEAAQAARGIAGSDTVTSVRQRAAEGISAVWERFEKFDFEASLRSSEDGGAARDGADNNSEDARVWPCEVWLTQPPSEPQLASDGEAPPALVEELPAPAALRLTAARELQLLAAYSAEGGGEGAVAHVFNVEALLRICMPPSRPGVLSFYFPSVASAGDGGSSSAAGEAGGEEPPKRRQPTFLARFLDADEARECARTIAGWAAAAKKRRKSKGQTPPPTPEAAASQAAAAPEAEGSPAAAAQEAATEVPAEAAQAAVQAAAPQAAVQAAALQTAPPPTEAAPNGPIEPPAAPGAEAALAADAEEQAPRQPQAPAAPAGQPPTGPASGAGGAPLANLDIDALVDDLFT